MTKKQAKPKSKAKKKLADVIVLKTSSDVRNDIIDLLGLLQEDKVDSVIIAYLPEGGHLQWSFEGEPGDLSMICSRIQHLVNRALDIEEGIDEGVEA